MQLLQVNVSRLDSLLKETRALNAQGFVEKIDVQRLDVQANNLKTELENVYRLQEMSYSLLKFQMGYPMEEPIRLSVTLEQIAAEARLPAPFVAVTMTDEWRQMVAYHGARAC
jgi:outer membrane protein TolC